MGLADRGGIDATVAKVHAKPFRFRDSVKGIFVAAQRVKQLVDAPPMLVEHGSRLMRWFARCRSAYRRGLTGPLPEDEIGFTRRPTSGSKAQARSGGDASSGSRIM